MAKGRDLRVDGGAPNAVCSRRGLSGSGLSPTSVTSLAVVATNDSSNAPIAYDRSKNTCTLKCHNFDHIVYVPSKPAGQRKLLGGTDRLRGPVS
jgi:hypothetical protein